jgi:hypothetical protein
LFFISEKTEEQNQTPTHSKLQKQSSSHKLNEIPHRETPKPEKVVEPEEEQEPIENHGDQLSNSSYDL